MNRLKRKQAWIRALSSILAVLALATPFRSEVSAAAQLPFDDISDSYAKDAIVRLYQANLIDGTGAGHFEPRKAVTRAELASMLDRLFGLESVAAAVPAFTDVPEKAWSYGWVSTAVQMGIVTGLSSSSFGPDRQVSRQDAAAMLARAAKQTLSVSSAAIGYKDADQIASYALAAVAQMKELGIMKGDGTTFRPAAPVTRQEAAVMMDNLLQREAWTSQIRAATEMKIQIGWQYGQTTAQFEKQVLSSNVNTLSPRWFFLESTGMTLSGYDASLLTWAHQHGKPVWAMVGNHSDREMTHGTLSDSAKRTAAVTYLVNEVKNNGLDGINVDFENVDPQDRSAFTQFIADLASGLDSVHAVLSVNLSPDTYSDWTDAYDYAALGKSADYIVMMGYDQHWNGGSAGSVSSLPWLESGLNTLIARVPASKIILAMPLYTRDWTVGSAGTTAQDWSLVYQNETLKARSPLMVWNADLGQYTASYSYQGNTHELWVEDGRSLAAKASLGERLGLAGYAYWYMGGESSDVWGSLRNEMKFSSYQFK